MNNFNIPRVQAYVMFHGEMDDNIFRKDKNSCVLSFEIIRNARL